MTQSQKNRRDDIRELYPPDLLDEGRELLWRAICDEWTALPDEILIRLHELCIRREQENE